MLYSLVGLWNGYFMPQFCFNFNFVMLHLSISMVWIMIKKTFIKSRLVYSSLSLQQRCVYLHLTWVVQLSITMICLLAYNNILFTFDEHWVVYFCNLLTSSNNACLFYCLCSYIIIITFYFLSTAQWIVAVMSGFTIGWSCFMNFTCSTSWEI